MVRYTVKNSLLSVSDWHLLQHPALSLYDRYPWINKRFFVSYTSRLLHRMDR